MFELLMAGLMGMAQNPDSLFGQEIFVDGADTLRYRIMYPPDFREDQRYPLVLFLHGSGERGDDNTRQLVHGAALFADSSIRTEHPAIVVFPQCPDMETWARARGRSNEQGKRIFEFHSRGKPTPVMQLLLAWLDHWSDKAFVDRGRLYVGGLSMGGMGTFELLYLRPRTFAAAFPICGGGDPRKARRYAGHTDCWIFHGALDEVIPPEYSEQMVRAIHDQGGVGRFTLYPEAAHNSWDRAFEEPELLPWLFSKRKDHR